MQATWPARILLCAFGQAGLERGLLHFVASSFLTNTRGVFVASRGRFGVCASLRAVAGVPVFYAVLLALALNLLHISVPDVLFRSIKLLGDASVPT